MMTQQTISYTQLKQLLAQTTKAREQDAGAFLDAMVQVIVSHLRQGEEVTINGIGVFRVVVMQQGARRVAFTPDEKMKDQVNSPFSCFEPVVLGPSIMADGGKLMTDLRIEDSDAACFPFSDNVSADALVLDESEEAMIGEMAGTVKSTAVSVENEEATTINDSASAISSQDVPASNETSLSSVSENQHDPLPTVCASDDNDDSESKELPKSNEAPESASASESENVSPMSKDADLSPEATTATPSNDAVLTEDNDIVKDSESAKNEASDKTAAKDKVNNNSESRGLVADDTDDNKNRNRKSLLWGSAAVLVVIIGIGLFFSLYQKDNFNSLQDDSSLQSMASSLADSASVTYIPNDSALNDSVAIEEISIAGESSEKTVSELTMPHSLADIEDTTSSDNSYSSAKVVSAGAISSTEAVSLSSTDADKSQQVKTSDSSNKKLSTDVSNSAAIDMTQAIQYENGKPRVIILQEGERLTLISEREFGSKAFWAYIYEVNKDHLKSPSNVPVGAKIYLPSVDYWQIDAQNAKSTQKAYNLGAQLLK